MERDTEVGLVRGRVTRSPNACIGIPAPPLLLSLWAGDGAAVNTVGEVIAEEAADDGNDTDMRVGWASPSANTP